ncbi:MAG: HAD-IC family P-type ATPase [Chloroherpetonaceae bacterium]|nr:HAD-IC family P-type ATPase [Chthonomonadaceae bacterium]MDW8206373.1 HAD-IC family P-type ATPase [Chloroherpetonaceae bacterium]
MASTTLQEQEITPHWHALDVQAALERAQSTEQGLTDKEAARRLEIWGPNALPQKKGESIPVLLWRQINSPLIWVLILASAIAMALGKVTDGIVVLAVVVVNALIGFVQEWRAGRAIAALAEMVPENAVVIRDGQQRTLPVSRLVPGDIVLLAAGDRVPADVRLLAVKGLQVEEAALTGESVPVFKQIAPVDTDALVGDRVCMAFNGSLVTAGTGRGLVVATGPRTELGRISTLMEQTTEIQTPLTRDLGLLGRNITIAIGTVSLILFALGMLRATLQGTPFGLAVRDTLFFSISLAVGAIPEGLPAIVTISLAIGVQRMAARHAIIRHLPAVETLGSATVICSDKTGTLTRNEMTVEEVWTPQGRCRITGTGYVPEGEFLREGEPGNTVPEDVRAALEVAALCNDSSITFRSGRWQISGDPTEAALVVAARKAGIDVEALRRDVPRQDEIPFDSDAKFMATLHPYREGGARILLKGAPEVIVARSTRLAGGQPVNPEQIAVEVERMAKEGMRVLALAEKRASDPENLYPEDVAEGLTLVALVGMIDPPRPEAIEAIRACHEAGIAVKMITGDHRGTAEAIGRQLGLRSDRPAITGVELAQLELETLQEVAEHTAVFARVAPEHKLRLVQALQARGHVVAMTGDGVNDAPALRQADIGVAMGITGTSVAKEASALVLTDDNFASIAAAVEEGRRVYDNLVKSLVFILPTNLGLALILIFSALFFPHHLNNGELLLPIQPTQLLWINLVASVSLALPLALEKAEDDVMRRPPRSPDQSILSRFVVIRTAIAAVLMALGSIALFFWEYRQTMQTGDLTRVLPQTETMVVTAVIMFQIFYMLECRSLRRNVFQIHPFSNPWVWVGIGVLLLLQALFIYTPLMNRAFESAPISWADFGLAALTGAIILPVMAFEKWLHTRGQLPLVDR